MTHPLLLFYLVVAIIEIIIIFFRRAVALDGAVEICDELVRILLAHTLESPDEDYVEETREREREEVDAFARVLAVEARPVVDCDF